MDQDWVVIWMIGNIISLGDAWNMDLLTNWLHASNLPPIYLRDFSSNNFNQKSNHFHPTIHAMVFVPRGRKGAISRRHAMLGATKTPFSAMDGQMTTTQTSCTIFRGTFIKLVLYFFQIDKNPTQKSSRNPWQTINFSAMLKARLVVPSGDLDKPLTLAMDCPWISGTYFWRVSWTL